MDKLKELQEEQRKGSERLAELRAIVIGSDGKNTGASWTAEQREEAETLTTQQKERDSEIAQLRQQANDVAAASRFDLLGDEESSETPEQKRIVVPARARSHRALKAFKFGDSQTENERSAYIAGHLYLAQLFNNRRSQEWCAEHGFQRTMNESTNPTGGFLVPDEMQRTIVRLREERGVFERYARSIPMASDSMFVPRDLSDVTAYWPAEAAEITASDLTVGGAELIAKKLACLTKVSSELDEDSIVDIGDMITRSCAYAMADKIDEAGFNGDGTSTYGGNYGLKSALDSSATFTATGDGFDELTLADGHDCIGKYPQYPGASPMWFMHSAGYWAWCARLQYEGGGNTVQDLGNGPQLQWLGYPVVFTQVLTSTITASTSTIIAFFGDLGLTATVGTRRAVNTMISVDRYFENDLIGIKSTQRIAINVHERGDTIRNRPMIALKTASS